MMIGVTSAHGVTSFKVQKHFGGGVTQSDFTPPRSYPVEPLTQSPGNLNPLPKPRLWGLGAGDSAVNFSCRRIGHI